MDPDMDKYDLEHVCTSHSRMTDEQWRQCYRDAWKRYYTPEHMETVLRRAHASGLSLVRIASTLTVFSSSVEIENVHPLQFGFFRRKIRTQRRHGLPLENPLVFYPRRLLEVLNSTIRWSRLGWRYRSLRKSIKKDPAARHYTDEALQPPAGQELDHFVEVFADKIPNTHGAPKQRVQTEHTVPAGA
jgi:hypothetical protein